VTIADIPLLTVIAGGALSFLSPCVLPLVPPYLCYMAGVSVEDFRGSAVPRRGRGNAARGVSLPRCSFTLGFATVFVALGAGASVIGAALRQHMDLACQGWAALSSF
jgi:cytochrome c-type biogenesis protein